jgi:hypothetical protein
MEPNRSGVIWDPEEEIALRKEIEEGLPIEQIAHAYHRTKYAIICRLDKLRIAHPTSSSIEEEKEINWLYTIKLKGDKYYVGRTKDPTKRFRDHIEVSSGGTF